MLCTSPTMQNLEIYLSRTLQQSHSLLFSCVCTLVWTIYSETVLANQFCLFSMSSTCVATPYQSKTHSVQTHVQCTATQSEWGNNCTFSVSLATFNFCDQQPFLYILYTDILQKYNNIGQWMKVPKCILPFTESNVKNIHQFPIEVPWHSGAPNFSSPQDYFAHLLKLKIATFIQQTFITTILHVATFNKQDISSTRMSKHPLLEWHSFCQ